MPAAASTRSRQVWALAHSAEAASLTTMPVLVEAVDTVVGAGAASLTFPARSGMALAAAAGAARSPLGLIQFCWLASAPAMARFRSRSSPRPFPNRAALPCLAWAYLA